MRHSIGDRGELNKPLPTTCCNYIIPEGSTVEIVRRTSSQGKKPRIVIVQHDNSLHTVKVSKIWFKGDQ